MSISLPTYTRRETPLLGRTHRIRAMIVTGLRRETRRPATIAALLFGTLSTTVNSILFLFLARLISPGLSADLSFFFVPASNLSILIFATLMAAAVGSGLIADDVRTMALSLYLSRPITRSDYLAAKIAILGPLVGLVTIVPITITPILAGLFGLVPYDIALAAFGIGIAVGLLHTAFYTTLALLLSSLTSRRAYSAAGLFAITFGLTVPVEILASPGSVGNPALLYVSPWEDYLAVARAAYQSPAGPIDWAPALAILLGLTFLAALVTYARMRSMEVVTG